LHPASEERELGDKDAEGIEKGIGKKRLQVFSELAETLRIKEKKFASSNIFSTFASRFGRKGDRDKRG
jgi:hypothetical protein